MVILTKSSKTYRPVMIFIDGGHFREGFKKIIGRKIQPKDFDILRGNLMRYIVYGNIEGELIRVYYYDAIADPSESPDEYKEEKEYFDNIRKCDFYNVKLGRKIKTGKDTRQKGVDILIAIDMLTKAFQNHYDFAGFVGGDDDFVDLIESVRELAGKRVIGFYIKAT